MNSQRSGRMTGAAALALAIACGSGYDGSPTAPTGGGSPGPSGATITINASGAVTPSEVTINVGQSVTFVNSHNRAHDVTSDPHPTHTDCPPINAVGRLQPGQSRPTSAFPTARTCGFHDHDDPENGALRGSIVIR